MTSFYFLAYLLILCTQFTTGFTLLLLAVIRIDVRFIEQLHRINFIEVMRVVI